MVGYLVATGLNNDVEPELQVLASLHGIGVLLLNTESLFDSQKLIPARERSSIDWQSVLSRWGCLILNSFKIKRP